MHGVDQENKVARAIAAAREDTEIFPLVNNYDPLKQIWQPAVGDFLLNPEARANVREAGRHVSCGESQLSRAVAGL